MSQDNPTNEKSPETRKRVLLGALLAVLAGVLYFQFFTGDDPRPANRGGVATGARPTPTPRPAARPGGTPEPIVSRPLDLASMTGKTPGEGTGRNIFVYPPPPPPPTPKPQPTLPPPPPPPVTLFSVNPSGVLARTGGFTLTVFGDKIPQDGQSFIDGREFPTTIVSATEFKVQIPAEAIRNAGNVGVQIRSRNDAKIFSNQTSLNVAEPPAPPYRFIGLIITKDGPMAVLKSQADEGEVFNVRKGGFIDKNRHWKVLSISPQRIEIEDTGIKISHSISFTGENG
ncbi:MAG: hypothetical protein ACKVX9_08760 [Blastocatellia bacterium]